MGTCRENARVRQERGGGRKRLILMTNFDSLEFTVSEFHRLSSKMRQYSPGVSVSQLGGRL